MGSKALGKSSKNEHFTKEKKTIKFEIMKNIILDGQKLPGWKPWEFAKIAQARPQIIERERCAPLRQLPASWWYWGAIRLSKAAYCSQPLSVVIRSSRPESIRPE